MRAGRKRAVQIAGAFAAMLALAAARAQDDVLAFARAPQFALSALSPDGARLSYVKQAVGRQHVVVRTLSSGVELRTLSMDPAREGVRWCARWLSVHTRTPSYFPLPGAAPPMRADISRAASSSVCL